MADDAIGHMKMLNEIDPVNAFFVYYVPGGTHAPHHPTPECIENSKASSTWSGTTVLPAGCAAPNVNGTTYFLCGNQPFDGANGIYYRVVPTP